MNYGLNDREIKTSDELADLYYWMDRDPRAVSYEDIGRLYGEAARNPNIHYRALEINKAKYLKRRKK